MVDDLSQYSIVAGKTYLDINFLSFIKEEYQFPYICGYLDGDGWIVHTQKARSFGMCGNQKTIDAIRNYLNDRYDWSLNLLQDKRSKQTYSFQTESNVKLTQFLNDYCGMAEWCKFYGLPYQTAIIKKMTDEEWEKA